MILPLFLSFAVTGPTQNFGPWKVVCESDARSDDGLFDRGWIGGGRQVGFEHANLGLLLVRKLGPATLGELLDRVLALFDE